MKKVALKELYIGLNWKIEINMNCLLLWIFILLATAYFVWKKKYVHPVDDDEQYPILAKLAKGSLANPVTKKSKKENSAVVKFWGAKEKFKAKGRVLTCNGKEVSLVRTSF